MGGPRQNREVNPYIKVAMEVTPKLIERLLRRFGEGRYDERLPDRFSVREVVAHLADWEPILRDRIRTAVEVPESEVEAFDEVARAEERGYSSTDPMASLEAWKSERAKTIEYVASLSEDAWHRRARHPERGWLTASDFAAMIPLHDIYHVEQLDTMLGEGEDRVIPVW